MKLSEQAAFIKLKKSASKKQIDDLWSKLWMAPLCSTKSFPPVPWLYILIISWQETWTFDADFYWHRKTIHVVVIPSRLLQVIGYQHIYNNHFFGKQKLLLTVISGMPFLFFQVVATAGTTLSKSFAISEEKLKMLLGKNDAVNVFKAFSKALNNTSMTLFCMFFPNYKLNL